MIRTIAILLVAHAALVVTTIRALAVAQDETAIRVEVASVKATGRKDGPIVFTDPPDGFSAQNTTVRELILMAYGADFQRAIEGAPRWISEDRFDVIIKATGLLPTVPGSSEPRRALVRALLAERFRLASHTEVRDLPIYALVLARTDGRLGRQLSPANGDCTSGCLSTGFGFFKAQQTTLDTFAAVMAGRLGRRVENRTGLMGEFTIDLEYTPLAPVPTDGSQPPPNPDRPSLFTAVQEQLGLRLESTHGAVEVLVIDQIDRPDAN